ncbi:MAG: hypothetical protein Q8M94_13705 [Ignavibacteria bacterium]|nr:hypothetical protein [Ignavibacteria bacterium]
MAKDALCLATQLLAGVNSITSQQARDLLNTVITVSGIALAILFAFLVQKYSEARGRFDTAVAGLQDKQKRLNLFRELCNASETSHEIWQALDKPPNNLKYDQLYTNTPRFLDGKKHSYAIGLYKAISDLGNKCYYGYHKSDQGKKLLTSKEIEDFQHLINEVWYVLSDTGKRYGVEDYFSSTNQRPPALTRNQKWIELLANSIYVSKFGTRYTTLDYWEEVTGDLFEKCDEMLHIHRQARISSPKEYLKNLSYGSLFLWGIVWPIVLLSIEVAERFFVPIVYVSIAGFLISLVSFSMSVSRIVAEDFYSNEFKP